MWVQSVFKSDNHHLPLMVRYYRTVDMDAGIVAWANRSYSKCQMVGKRESCNRSTFDVLGDLMEGDMNSMTIDQVSRQINFTEYLSPTYNPSETKATIMENIRVNAFNIENAYPWTCLCERDDYQAFIEILLIKNAMIA